MTRESSIQEIFNQVLEGKPQTVLFFDKAHYESTRANLLRKFKNYRGLLSDLGGPSLFGGQYFQCSWNSTEVSGLFKLAQETEKQAVPRKLFVKDDL